jgi:hypothetical protein
MENDAKEPIKPMQRHTIELNDKELSLLEMLLRRVKDHFYVNYRIAAKKRLEEQSPEQEKLFSFYRDASLISERLQERFKDIVLAENPEYNFADFEHEIALSLPAPVQPVTDNQS